jgi:hypothetical protein
MTRKVLGLFCLYIRSLLTLTLGHDTQVVLRHGCRDFENIFEHVTGNAPQSKVELCQRHYNEWLHKYFFTAPVLLLTKEMSPDGGGEVPRHEPEVCFRKLIIGHPRSLSQLVHTSQYFDVRVMRDRVWRRMSRMWMQSALSSAGQASIQQQEIVTQHRVTVLEKVCNT